ncbi:MAG: hypothetical protein MRY76_04610 [Pseudomonadales bacterium]|nr:hypothetical protein [Pseudomonadales bacterium]
MSKLLKVFGIVLGTVVVLLTLLFIAQRLASERVEVVELHAPDAAGEMITTRLWIVDEGGQAYLRVGASGSGWFDRLQSAQAIELTRNGERRPYRAEPRPEKSAAINALMQAKYTWGDSFMAVLAGSREGSIPIALQPLP